MTSHGSALLSLPYVHSQANLNNTYFDHTNIILYDVSRIINSLALRSGQILNLVSPIDVKNSSCFLVQFFLGYPGVLGDSVNSVVTVQCAAFMAHSSK